jgi:hypothetical protein
MDQDFVLLKVMDMLEWPGNEAL